MAAWSDISLCNYISDCLKQAIRVLHCPNFSGKARVMSLVKKSIQGGRRKSAIRAGILSVSSAAAALCCTITARADLSGFSTFATPNINTNSSTTGIGYGAGNSTFETTNNNGGEAVSGFSSTPQTITSFDLSFTLTVTGGQADGGSIVIQNSAAGLTDLGASGGSGGYQGSGTNSIALEWEYYNTPSSSATGENVCQDGLGYNGAAPTYQYFFNAPNQGGNGPYYRNLPVLDSGDQIQFNLAYYGTTLTENIVDLTNHTGLTQVYSNVNIPSTVGGNTAYVGFTGATGGATSTQVISNFTLVSNKTYAPISIASGFNEKGIVPVGGSLASITATQDNGTAKGQDTWYEKGFDTAAPTTGLPSSGSLFVSQSDGAHQFQMQSYAGNDVVLLSSASTNSGPTSATITFSSQTQPYNALSFLTASGNGPNVLGLTITYAANASGGVATPSTGLSFLSPDWFSGAPSAWTANGRYSGTFDNVNSGNPNLYAEDVLVPDNVDPIASLTVTFQGGNRTPTGNVFIFAVSGEAGAAGPVITYTGAQSNVWDSVHDNFNGMSGSLAVPVNFVNGDTVNFDDTATGSHTVDVTGTNLNISGWNVNTTSGYTFYGNGLTGSGGLTLSGTGNVVLANSNTYTGQTNIKSGLLQLNSSSAIASTTISVAAGATLNISSGAKLTGTAVIVSDSGTVNDFNSSENLGQLAGLASGVLNLNGTALTVGTMGFAGTIGGTSGSVTLTAGGTMSGTINDGTTSPISVTYNGSSSSLVMSGSSTYTGGTYLKAGSMEVGTSTSLGNGTIYLQGGALGAASAIVNVSNYITGGALIVPSGTNTLELSNASNSFTGPVLIQSGATLQVDNPGAIAGLNGANATTGTITVASGGSLLVNDNSGTLGLTGGVAGGAPITVTISGAGENGNGALAGTFGNTVTWAGNVNVSGPATIAAGDGGTLILTGAISGTGPVLFASASNDSGVSYVTLAPSASLSSYTDESQVTGDLGNVGAITVNLGANNGFSSASGLNFLTTSTAPLTVDLAGYNQSLQYITGAGNSNFQLTNSNLSTLSTLTLTGALRNGLPIFCATALQGNLQLVMNDPTGNSNQILTGNSGYSGGTTITKGTLTAGSPNALGTGPVLLNGGTLGLSTPGIPVASTPILTPSSFNSANLTLTEGNINTSSPSFAGNTLTITTTGINNTANSAFYNTKVPISDTLGFTANFTWTINGGADGIAFVLQNDPRGAAAVGSGGNSLAYQGAAGSGLSIVNSAAAQFELFGANSGVAFGSGGNIANIAPYQSTSPVALDQAINVTLVYNGPAQTLTETLVGADTTTFTTTFTGIDYAALTNAAANGNTAYIGFTGSTGGISATQMISNFSYAQNLPFSQTPTSPTAISNAINAAASTSSVIEIGTSSTSTTAGAVGAINIASGAVVALSVAPGNPRGVLIAPSVSIATGVAGAFTGKLDLGSNDLVLTNSTIAQTFAMVKQGYANGSWNGNGIASSAAAGNSTHLTALGVIVNDTGSNIGSSTGTALYTTLEGADLTNGGSINADGEILVKYTYYGDTNLDGAVDGSDYSNIDNGYLNHLTGWYNGDFNYDGVVDGSDYTLIDNAFNMQGSSLGSNPAAQLATATAQITGSSSAVPEPASMGVVAVAVTTLLGRRRRRD
jgi:fibronectin-binding autotransporter adhesin